MEYTSNEMQQSKQLKRESLIEIVTLMLLKGCQKSVFSFQKVGTKHKLLLIRPKKKSFPKILSRLDNHKPEYYDGLT